MDLTVDVIEIRRQVDKAEIQRLVDKANNALEPFNEAEG
jgi:hypothetical protein